MSWLCPVVISSKGFGSAVRSLNTASLMWKNSITVLAASNCSEVKVSDGCGFTGIDETGDDGDVTTGDGDVATGEEDC